jgi:hypothetical protein
MHLDCGTTKQELINDPLYLGPRQPRVSTEELDAFVDEFVDAVQKVFAGCCIHFEDWARVDAVRLLARATGTGGAATTTTFKVLPQSDRPARLPESLREPSCAVP